MEWWSDGELEGWRGRGRLDFMGDLLDILEIGENCGQLVE
jgi:hypothetical protein